MTLKGALPSLLALILLSNGVAAMQFRGAGEPLIGWYEIDGYRRNLAAVFHERRDGARLIGATMGALDSLVLEEGSVSGRNLSIVAHARIAGMTQRLTIDARLGGPTINGNIVGPSGTGALMLRPAEGPIVERGFFFAGQDTAGNPVPPLQVATAFNSREVFYSGRFKSERLDECWNGGCEGDIVSFEDTGTRLTVRFQSDGPCRVVTDAVVTFDAATRLYSGAFNTRGCGADQSGTLLGARGAGTRSEHVIQILSAFTRLADDIENANPMPRPHPSFLAGYLHHGRTLNDLMDVYDLQKQNYTMRKVTFDRVRQIQTIVDPLAFPGLELPPNGVHFDERHEGLAVAAGARETYIDSRTRPGLPRLELWAEGPAGWAITGNGFPGIDLPFIYTPNPLGTLEISTPGGTVWVSPGPFGAHTGHLYGDAKTNFSGFFSNGYEQMVDLGNGDGVRDPGESWGYYGGPDGELIRNRIPVYRSPADAELEAVVMEALPSGFYFDNPGQWGVTLRFPDSSRLHLGHLSGVHQSLRDRLLGELGIDVWAYTGPPGVVISPGSGLRISAGEPVALPQVVATEYSAFPGYYTGKFAGPGVDVPWAQMEFAMIGPVTGFRDSNVCIYEFMPWAVHSRLQQALDDEMANPDSLRFERIQDQRWIWSAEGRACNGYSPLPVDFSSLDTNLGGWYESQTVSDEIVSFVTMARDTASFDRTLYDPANIGQLIRRMHAFAAPWNWSMPDGSTARPFFPAGELLERTDSSFLVKWRDIGYRDASGAQRPAYQWAAYLLDPLGLKVSWGPFLDAPHLGTPPVLTAAMPCNGINVVCYNHVSRPGY